MLSLSFCFQDTTSGSCPALSKVAQFLTPPDRFEEGIQVFTLTSDGDTYSANVADCGVISQPVKGVYYYDQGECAAKFWSLWL